MLDANNSEQREITNATNSSSKTIANDCKVVDEVVEVVEHCKITNEKFVRSDERCS